MVSRRSMSVLVILALTVVGTRADAQVRPLGAVDQPSAVQQASCVGGVGCASGGCAGDCGTVWGTTCMDPCSCGPGLYPPCPNPCRTTLVGELLMDVHQAVCTSLSTVFCFALSPCRAVGCGTYACGDCGTCGGCVTGAYDSCCDMGTVGDCGCAAPSDCNCGGSSSSVVPLEVGQPAPPAVNQQPNPFRDDPVPQGSGTSVTPQTSRTRSILPAPRAAMHPQAPRRAVRRASYQEPQPAATQPPSRQPAARQSSFAPRHYQPQRTAQLRPTQAVQLQPVPQQAKNSTPALRFRDEQ